MAQRTGTQSTGVASEREEISWEDEFPSILCLRSFWGDFWTLYKLPHHFSAFLFSMHVNYNEQLFHRYNLVSRLRQEPIFLI